MTKLADWMKTNKLRDSDLARLVGVSRAQVNRVMNGMSAPSLALAAKIKKATKGAVTADDFAAEALAEADTRAAQKAAAE